MKKLGNVEAIRVTIPAWVPVIIIIYPVFAWAQLNDPDRWNEWVFGGISLLGALFVFFAVMNGSNWRIQCLIGEKWVETHSGITYQHAQSAKKTLQAEFPDATLYQIPFQPIPAFIAFCCAAGLLLIELN